MRSHNRAPPGRHSLTSLTRWTDRVGLFGLLAERLCPPRRPIGASSGRRLRLRSRRQSIPSTPSCHPVRLIAELVVVVGRPRGHLPPRATTRLPEDDDAIQGSCTGDPPGSLCGRSFQRTTSGDIADLIPPSTRRPRGPRRHHRPTSSTPSLTSSAGSPHRVGSFVGPRRLGRRSRSRPPSMQPTRSPTSSTPSATSLT
jgi:hypothetical protein